MGQQHKDKSKMEPKRGYLLILRCERHDIPAICYGEDDRLSAINMARMLNSGEHKGQEFADQAFSEVFKRHHTERCSEFQHAEVKELHFETGHIARVEL